MADLRSYRPVWREPSRGGFGPYEIVGLGLPERREPTGLRPRSAGLAPKATLSRSLLRALRPRLPALRQGACLKGALSEEVIAALAAQGREIVEIEPENRQFIGYWAGLKIDPQTGRVQASATGDGYAAAR